MIVVSMYRTVNRFLSTSYYREKLISSSFSSILIVITANIIIYEIIIKFISKILKYDRKKMWIYFINQSIIFHLLIIVLSCVYH